MIPPFHTVRRTLLLGERIINQRGWAQPPKLMAMRFEGPVLLLDPMPIQVSGPSVGAFLAYLAEQFEQSDAGQRLVDLLGGPEFAGFAFVGEGWANDAVPEYLDRPLADCEGSYQVRQALAVDVAARRYWLLRRRDHPGPAEPLLSDSFLRVDGDITSALRAMCLAIARRMPPGTADVHALQTAQFLTGTEVVGRDSRSKMSE